MKFVQLTSHEIQTLYATLKLTIATHCKRDKEKCYKMRSVLLSKDIVPGLAQCLPEGIGYIKINPGHILCLAKVHDYLGSVTIITVITQCLQISVCELFL